MTENIRIQTHEHTAPHAEADADVDADRQTDRTFFTEGTAVESGMLIVGGDVVLEMVTCDEDEESIKRDEVFEERKKPKLVQRNGDNLFEAQSKRIDNEECVTEQTK